MKRAERRMEIEHKEVKLSDRIRGNKNPFAQRDSENFNIELLHSPSTKEKTFGKK